MEISKIATSMSLSEALLATGVDRKTADMFYPIGMSFPEVCDNGDNMQADYPAWSLDALINLLVGWNVVFYVDEHLMWHCHCWRRVGESREDISQCDFGKIEAICRVIVYLKNRGEI